MTDFERLTYGGFLCQLNEEGVYPDDCDEIGIIERAKLRGYQCPDQSKMRPDRKREGRERA